MGTLDYNSSVFETANSSLVLVNNSYNSSELDPNGTVPNAMLQQAMLVGKQLHDFYDTLGYVVLVLYLTTFLFGVTGNSLTILVILRNKRMKTVATCFILNLAIADNLFMLSLPFMAHSTFTKNWLFGTPLCKIMYAFFGINLYASIYTMVLMSVDRYLAVGHPLKSLQYRTNKNAAVVCVILWIICFIILIPYWMYAQVIMKSNGHGTCRIMWPKAHYQDYNFFWTNFELLIGFIAPILVMLVCYLLLLKNLVFESGPVREQTRKPIKKVTMMVFTVTLVFVLCWTPYRIFKYQSMQQTRYYSKHHIVPSVQQTMNSAIFQTVAQALVFVSSCCNPFIYAISSRNFRRLYLAALCWTPAAMRRRRYTLQHTSTWFAGRSPRRVKSTVMATRLLEESAAGNEVSERTTENVSSVFALQRMPFTQNGRINCVHETNSNGL